MVFNPSDLVHLDINDYVTVTKMGHIIEVQHMQKTNNRNNIKKISADEYVDLKTGEKKLFNKSNNRACNINSLRQTFKSLRYLINNNFFGRPNELHVTLTYAENMTCAKRLYSDVDKYLKRLRYRYKDVSTIDYINVVEPQERGAWHCHLLLRFNDLESIYIKNSDMAELWGHGFVTIKSMTKIDNIGAYLSAYLTDVEVSEDTNHNDVVLKNVEGKRKKFVKGGRLYLYPVGMKLYRSSRGCKKPERIKMKYKDIKKVVGNNHPHYSSIKHIEQDNFENTITYIQYNLKR